MGSRLQPSSSLVGKSDSDRWKLERDVRVMRSLATEEPILGARCPKDQARLFFCSVRMREGRTPDNEDLEAAKNIVACVHRELRERSSPLDIAAAWELSNAKRWAIKVLADRRGKTYAKEIELQLTQGEPLTICMGSPKPAGVETAAGLLHVPVLGLGCRRVFPDSVRTTGGHMWRYWCDDCPPNRAQPLRSARRAHEKRVHEWVRATLDGA
jgi:hypothetical protein